MPCKCALCGYETSVTEDFLKWPDIPGLDAPLYPVTNGGKPQGRLNGFICGRCLHDANAMRLFMKTLLSGVTVTKHAIHRFIMRTGLPTKDDRVATVAILRAYSKARRIRFRPEYSVERLLNNNFREVDYYWVSDLVFVVTRETPRRIVTVEKLWGKALNRDFFYDEPT